MHFHRVVGCGLGLFTFYPLLLQLYHLFFASFHLLFSYLFLQLLFPVLFLQLLLPFLGTVAVGYFVDYDEPVAFSGPQPAAVLFVYLGVKGDVAREGGGEILLESSPLLWDGRVEDHEFHEDDGGVCVLDDGLADGVVGFNEDEVDVASDGLLKLCEPVLI